MAINKRKIIVRKPSGPSEWSWFILTNDPQFPAFGRPGPAGRSKQPGPLMIAMKGSAVLEAPYVYCDAGP